MKISVVIPVYNVAPWIEGSLRSVFAQSEDMADTELECIVVDDCGTDSSMEIVQQLAEQASECMVSLRMVSHTQNRGLATARNTGNAAATGDYIFYLDGDDQLEPGALLALSTAAISADYPDWVQGNYRRVDAQGVLIENTTYYNSEEPIYENRAAVVRGFDKLNFTNVMNKLVRTDFIRDNALSYRDGIIYEDTLWCMQAYHVVEKIATLEAITYIHNQRDGSIMRSDMTVNKLDSLLYIVKYLTQTPRDMNVEHKAVIYAVYGMKNLYLTRSFPKEYRLKWMAEIWATGVRDMDIKGTKLQPLSRLVGRSFALPLWCARVYLGGLLWAYGIFSVIKGNSK